MNNKPITIFIVLLLILPTISALVKIQLGQPYVNIEDISKIKFTSHSDYYEICSLDSTIIPILIENKNEFPDTFKFEINKEYASLPVKSAVLKSQKSAVLPLTITPPIDLEENTTLTLDIITKKEALKRSITIKTNIKKCYLFELKIDKNEDEICGCGKETYSLTLNNDGQYTDTFTLALDTPNWVNSTLKNKTIKLYSRQKREIRLEASPPCKEKGVFTISAEAVSEKTKAVLKDKLELTVSPQDKCYNTIISADNADIDHFGKNIPITIKNKGIKDAAYSLSVEGIDWYVLSQTDFTLKQNKEKTINLALHPNENIVEGSYNIDIKAKIGDKEFTKSIIVKLKRKGTVFEKIKFYLNYFKYHIGLGAVLLVIILLLAVIAKKIIKKKKIKEKLKIEKPKKKIEEKKNAKIIKKEKKKINWLPYIIYLIALVLFVLFTYSTFKYRPYYEKALNFMSRLFTNYMLPYGSYLKYLILGIGIAIIIILIIDFFRKRPKKKGKKKKEKKVKKEKEQKITEEKKVSKKIIKKRKLKLFEYIYLILVISLFLAIIGYTIYKSSGKSISPDKFKFITNFIQSYSSYFIIAIIILVLLIAVINFIKKTRKKPKKIKEKKVAKKSKKKINKKIIRNLAIIIIGLVILSGIVYSFVYYNLISHIRDFLVIYYPYILMGIGILLMLMLILHFQRKNTS